MENNNYWNDAAKYGAILGAILSVSFLLETAMTLTGSMTWYKLLGVEFVAVAVLHYYLLHRYTRRRSQSFNAEEGFSFGQGYGYVLLISGLAGFIVGVVQFVYLHLIMGYATYIDKYSAAITELLSQMGNLPASIEPIFAELFEQLENTPEPSVFSTVFGGVFSSLLFGGIFGLIIAGVLSRAPKPFDPDFNE